MGISFNVSAEEGLIPDWIKSTAGFWVDGQIGDAEFLSALQYLVKEELLVIPDETSSEIVTISEQELTTSKSKTTEDTLDYGTSYKFTYNIGDKVENKQNVDFTYEFYNGDTWIKGAGLRILCYMSDGDFREGGMGLFLPLLPYENYKNSKTRIYDVNTAVIEKCEIIDETITPTNRIIVDSLDIQMATCESRCKDGRCTGALMRGLVTNNESQDIKFTVNFRGYDNEGNIVASRVPMSNSDYVVKAGQVIPIGGEAEIKSSFRDKLKVTSCKIAVFQTK